MIKTNNPKVKYLIDATIKKNSSDITSGLADLGGGHMPQGMYNLWKDGELIGVVEGVAGTAVVIGICVLVQVAVHKWRTKQAITTLVDESDARPNAHISDTGADNGEVQRSVDGRLETTE